MGYRDSNLKKTTYLISCRLTYWNFNRFWIWFFSWQFDRLKQMFVLSWPYTEWLCNCSIIRSELTKIWILVNCSSIERSLISDLKILPSEISVTGINFTKIGQFYTVLELSVQLCFRVRTWNSLKRPYRNKIKGAYCSKLYSW